MCHSLFTQGHSSWSGDGRAIVLLGFERTAFHRWEFQEGERNLPYWSMVQESDIVLVQVQAAHVLMHGVPGRGMSSPGRRCNERQRCHQHHPVDPVVMLIRCPYPLCGSRTSRGGLRGDFSLPQQGAQRTVVPLHTLYPLYADYSFILPCRHQALQIYTPEWQRSIAHDYLDETIHTNSASRGMTSV